MSTQQKNSSFNTVTVGKEMITQRNSFIPGLRRFKPTVKRDSIQVKLPVIAKKPSSTLQRMPSIPVHDSSPVQLSSALVISPFSPRQSIAISPHLTTIKDNIIKENLTQKAMLRCKSPRAGSAFSRSTVFMNDEDHTKSYRPLQGMDVGSLLGEATRNRLTQLFNKLDTDKDGHLSYTQVQKYLPGNLPHAQMTFFRVLYDIISGTTYFGLQEFYATAIIVEILAKQDSMLWKTFLDDVDFNYYHDEMLELLEDFNKQCFTTIGIITYDNLLELILKRTNNKKIDRITNELEYIMPRIKLMKINRLEFIALLPAIIYIQSCLDPTQVLFRFRENSLLDRHLQQALLT